MGARAIGLSGALAAALLLGTPAGAEKLVRAPLDPAKEVSRIAFGSCAKQTKPQPIWESVVGLEPDLFLMIGDNVYGDTKDEARLRAQYKRLLARPRFRLLLRKVPFLATWDDHDYGWDDAGRDYVLREESRKAFLDFLVVPADSPRRARDGIWHSVLLGPEDRRVQVILLDTRSHRTDLTKRPDDWREWDGYPGPYVPTDDPEGDFLGAEQWTWLEEQLRQPARLRLLVSSIQIVAEDHGWEKWANIPAQRSRLLELLASTRAEGVVILSGDRHIAELSLLPAKGRVDGLTGEVTPNPLGYPLYDLTSSSLNHPVDFVNERNRHRLGARFNPINFGMIDVDWKSGTLMLEIRGLHGNRRIGHRVALDDLRMP